MLTCVTPTPQAKQMSRGTRRSDRMEPDASGAWMGETERRSVFQCAYSDTYIPVQPNLPPQNQPHKSEREHNNVSESASTSNKEEKKAVNCV